MTEQPSDRWERWNKILEPEVIIADQSLIDKISQDTDELLKKLKRANAGSNKDNRVQSVPESSFPINEVTEIVSRPLLPKDSRIALRNLIWIDIIKEVFIELHSTNQGNQKAVASEGKDTDKEHRHALYRVLHNGMQYFKDFFENEGHGRINSKGQWDTILQGLPWYIEPSLLLDASKISTAIVALLEAHIRKPRSLRQAQAMHKDADRIDSSRQKMQTEDKSDQDKLDYLFEWVRCLHESEGKGAKLFQSERPCPLSDLKSMSDSAGNTVLMMAARAESLQTFLYIFNYDHRGRGLLVSKSQEKTEGPEKEEFQLHLLNETNMFKENILHVLCKLPRRELRIETVISEFLQRISEENSTSRMKLIESKDFFGKNILHQFFSQKPEQAKTSQNKPEQARTSQNKPEQARTSQNKSEREGNPKEDLLSLLRSESVIQKAKEPLARKMLVDEDSSGYNVLLTALKNNNTDELLIQTLCKLNGGFITSDHLRNKNGIDIVHVLAAYGNLEVDLNKLNKQLTDWNKPGAADQTKRKVFCGGEIGLGLNRKDSNIQKNTDTGERDQKNKNEIYIFGGPIKSLKMLPQSPRLDSSHIINTNFEVLLSEESGKSENIVLKLDERDAKLEFDGWNAMHFACRHGNAENITYLLKKGYRADQLTSQQKTGGELALQAGKQEKLREALYKSDTKGWLSRYVASVDPISSAFDYISEDDANRMLKARDPILRAEMMYVERALKLEQYVSENIHLLKRYQWKEWDKRIRHYLDILNRGESVETYLYLCLQLDSAELYKCLINSNYWKNAAKTMSIEEIEDNTVLYIMGKREFEDRWKKNVEWTNELQKYREDATTYLQATTISAKLEQRDFVQLTITEDYDDEDTVCCKGCYMLPVCCKKCCAGKATERRSQILKYKKNGVIFLAYSQKKTDILEKYNLIGLALLTGRVEMVKCLLMTRQYDLIPTALQIVIQTNKLISFGDSHKSPILVDIKQFATHVILNALNTLYAGSDGTEACIFHYFQGQLEINKENSASRELTLKEKGKKRRARKETKQFYTGEYYHQQPEDAAECEVRKKSVDFYARCQGYWPDDASLVCEYAPTGPYYQHHLMNGTKFKFRDDRRAMKWLMLDINRLPMYNVLELAKKSHIKAIFSTNCFQELAERLWLQPVAVVATQTRENEEPLKSCCDRPVNWRNVFCPYGIHIIHTLSYLFYLAIFMIYILRAGYKFGWEQVILCIYVFSFIVQELYEAFEQINTIGSGISQYLKNVWNIYDWLLIIFTTAGIAIVATIGFDLSRSELSIQSEIEAFLNSGNVLLQVYNSKMVLGIGFVFSALRLLSTLRYFASTGGSLAIMQYIFFYDILPFVLILAIIIGAFGTYFYTMLTIGGYEFYHNQTFQGDRDKLTLVEVYSRPILAMFGGFDLDNTRRCKEARLTEKSGIGCVFEQGANVYIYCGMFFFIIIVNLVMVNMLIARFSATVDRKNKRSMIDWMYNRFKMLCDYKTASPLPPPFNLFYYGPMAFYYVYRQNEARREPKKGKENNAEPQTGEENNAEPRKGKENNAKAQTGEENNAKAQTGEENNAGAKKEKADNVEKFFVIQAERFSGKRAQLYRNPCLVYEEDDDEEDAEPTAVYIDFMKLDYQEDEAIQEGVETQNRPRTGRSKTQLPRSRTMLIG